jgi:hypothetical protein
MVRKILAVLIGGVVTVVLLSLIGSLGHQIYPVPQGLDASDRVAMAEYFNTLPLLAFGFVLASWAIGTIVGVWVACLVAGENIYLIAGVIGALILAGSIMKLVAIPYPWWFSISGVLLVVLMTFTAARLASK